jgi:hypothetical protein
MSLYITYTTALSGRQKVALRIRPPRHTPFWGWHSAAEPQTKMTTVSASGPIGVNSAAEARSGVRQEFSKNERFQEMAMR